MGKRKRFQHQEAKKTEDAEFSAIPKLIEELPADDTKFSKFTDFPLSSRTQKGLRGAGYAVPTDIQKAALRLAMQGRDMLGAARTGSGKTLAFLIPVIEKLWRERWSPMDGLGALIISPTRELAYQTFEVLRKIGCHHDFSAGLVIGGKELAAEQKRIGSTNIVICTPGRLLQHMDETPEFTCDNLQVLVLDEADRILDLGFAATLNAIVENLPASRQTMLFSATQTKSVRDLARLSLQDPEYVAVHEAAQYSTPQKLTQSFMEVKLGDKMMILYSFIRTNLQTKGIVFMSCCKQVKFVYECCCRLRPGVPLLALYGKQKQVKRMAIYNDFRKKQHAYLFATDIAARGLDFPAVNWVIQMDCPEDASTYIHRAGRTARFEKDGQALLMLLPSEKEGMLKALEGRKVPIDEIRPNPRKLQPIVGKLMQFCAAEQDMKHWAQKTFKSYVRSVFLQSDKSIFDVQQIPLDDYAKSLGLVSTPKVRYLKKAEKIHHQPVKSVGISSESESSSDESEGQRHSVAGVDKSPGKGKPKLTQRLAEPESDDGDSDDDDDDVLLKARKPRQLDEAALGLALRKDEELEAKRMAGRVKTKAQIARPVLKKKNIQANSRVVFDEDGEVESVHVPEADVSPYNSDDDLAHLQPVPLGQEKKRTTGGLDLAAAEREMKGADRADLQRHRQRIKEKHQEKRLKLRQQRREQEEGADAEEDAGVQLGAALPQDSYSDDSGEEEAPSPVPAKKRRKAAKQTFRKQQDGSADEEDNSTGGTVRDDEALALHLLAAR